MFRILRHGNNSIEGNYVCGALMVRVDMRNITGVTLVRHPGWSTLILLICSVWLTGLGLYFMFSVLRCYLRTCGIWAGRWPKSTPQRQGWCRGCAASSRHGWIHVGNGGSYGMGRRGRGAVRQKGNWSRSRCSRLAIRRHDERYQFCNPV